MTTIHKSDLVVLIHGDAMEALGALTPESVHCCVTSPPYWGLRDYGVDGQIGLEPTPGEWVEKMVEVFRGVRRALREDGTLWLNLGDCYCGGSRGGDIGGKSTLEGSQSSQEASKGAAASCRRDRRAREDDPHKAISGLKPKDLVGLPWMLAFALRGDGWWLRSDIIWAKSNPMPESVQDRPTKGHEYLFLLSKSQNYYYDADAIREPEVYGDHPRTVRGLHKAANTPGQPPHTGLRPGYTDKQSGHGRRHAGFNERWKNRDGISKDDYDDRKWQDRSDGVSRPPMTMKDREYNPAGRNKRTVWTIPTQPMPQAHFAAFPEKLVEPCILAGCPAGGTVLDPFCGSGTTGVVAVRHERHFVGIDLNREYLTEIAQPRIDREERKDRQPGLPWSPDSP